MEQEKDNTSGHGLALEHVVDSLAKSIGSRFFVEQHLPFDKDGRRAGDTYAGALLHVSGDALLGLRTRQIACEPISIEPEFLGVLDEKRAWVIQILPRVLITVQTIVHLPKLALIACGF